MTPTAPWPTSSIHRVAADGVSVFYRESGPVDAPVILLLHGFPSSSFQYRELIPRLADRFRVIAPDLPGFGFTEVPADRHYPYTFDQLARTVEAFTEALQLTRYALYVFDYGAPTGLRLAMAHPERVTAIVSQNGNTYEEGLGDAWAPIRRYWSQPTSENREAIRAALTPEGMRREYSSGISDPTLIKPESYTLDAALLARPGNTDIQLDLFLDYRNNVALYPAFQQYFREHQPPLLAIWGKHDPYFIPAGAEAFRRDLPNATIQFLDTGHFALETHVDEVAEAMRTFLAPITPASSPADPPTNHGLTTVRSNHSVDETVARITAILQAGKVILFAVIDHSAEAEKAGIPMPPTKLLIFGNPAAGTPLMLAAPTAAIDLPLKLLVAQDAANQVWITWNAPTYLQQRHLFPIDLLNNIASLETLARKAAI